MQEMILFAQHHIMLAATLFISVTCLAFIELIKSRQANNQRSPSQATQLINHDNAVVVDVRLKDAFASGHIIDAVSYPLKELSQNTGALDKYKARPLIVVCTTGNESRIAAALLKAKGFTVYVLAGGLRAWSEAELPLVKN